MSDAVVAAGQPDAVVFKRDAGVIVFHRDEDSTNDLLFVRVPTVDVPVPVVRPTPALPPTVTRPELPELPATIANPRQGPKGDPGPQGPTGADGRGTKRWFGLGPPSTVIGAQPGDEYVDTVTGDLYFLD